jgi:hypothetical protein
MEKRQLWFADRFLKASKSLIVTSKEILISVEFKFLIELYFRVNFLSDVKETRQKRLKEEFDFDCECVACTEDWPTARAPEMKMKFAKYLDVIKKSFKAEPWKIVKDFAPILNKEAAHYPSRELVSVQKIILQNILKLTVPKAFCT